MKNWRVELIEGGKSLAETKIQRGIFQGDALSPSRFIIVMMPLKLLETKLSDRNFIKGINTWAVPLIRYSEPFLKWTRDELRQMDQRTRKLMTMHKALHPRKTWTYYMYQEKREEEDLPASKTALTHRFNDSKTT